MTYCSKCSDKGIHFPLACRVNKNYQIQVHICHDTRQDLRTVLTVCVCQKCCNVAILKASEIVDNPSPGPRPDLMFWLCVEHKQWVILVSRTSREVPREILKLFCCIIWYEIRCRTSGVNIKFNKYKSNNYETDMCSLLWFLIQIDLEDNRKVPMTLSNLSRRSLSGGKVKWLCCFKHPVQLLPANHCGFI